VGETRHPHHDTTPQMAQTQGLALYTVSAVLSLTTLHA
jgi:hypothetical protein